MFMEAARELGRRTLAAGGPTDPERVEYAFRRVLARPPKVTEQTELLTFLNGQRERIESGQLDPLELVGGDSTLLAAGESMSGTELAAWTAVSRVLLNLDEAITRE